MPKEIILDPVVEVNGVDLTDRCRQAECPISINEVDQSTFGGKWSEQGKGMRDATVTLSFIQDYAAASVHATLYPLVESDDPFIIKVKPHDEPVSATNPQGVMTA